MHLHKFKLENNCLNVTYKFTFYTSENISSPRNIGGLDI